MKITEVEVRAVKGIRYIALKPRAGVTIIGGRNGQGKSSLQDAISYSLGGAKLLPKCPIKDGEQTGMVRVKLDGDPERQLPAINVVRTFERREDGSIKSQLSITDAENGMAAPSPQTLLDDCMGRKRIGSVPIGYNPMRFASLPAGEQIELLQSLVGLDFSDIDSQAKQVSERRRSLNRDAAERKAALARLPKYDGVPEKPIDLADLLAQGKADAAKQRANDEQRAKLREIERNVKHIEGTIDEAHGRIVELQQKLAAQQNILERNQRALADAVDAAKKGADVVARLVDPDLDARATELRAAHEVNNKVSANAKHEEESQKLSSLNHEIGKLTDMLDSLAKQREERTAAVVWPLEGLGFSEEVTMRGRPLSQLSSAEKLEVSVAIGAAMHPTLNLMFIDNGSLLDDEHKLKIAELAARHNAQVFLEVVSTEHCHLVMKDGEAIEMDDELVIGTVQEEVHV